MRRGSALILVLLLVSCLFVLVSGFLAKKTAEARVAQLTRQKLQAREVAMSGLETVRVKLLNDGRFPPNLGGNQEVFAYSESVRNLASDQEIGRFQVHCDRRWAAGPYDILRVTVVGQVGDASNPVRHRLTGEFSLKAGQRGLLINLVDSGTF
ncbi:hypothetical protein JST97_20080 [bacterium]|nr:hypothetical protein [bacterium]